MKSRMNRKPHRQHAGVAVLLAMAVCVAAADAQPQQFASPLAALQADADWSDYLGMATAGGLAGALSSTSNQVS
jgi:hypothetical protein